MTAPLRFAGKGPTLAALFGHLKTAIVPPLAMVSVAAWQADRDDELERLSRLPWIGAKLAVRSSAANEDGTAGSQAGAFDSVLNIVGPDALAAAIDTVIASYGTAATSADQVLVQAQVLDVARAGVAFSRDPSTGGPYRVVSWTEDGRTDTVTAGRDGKLQGHVHHRASPVPAPVEIAPVLALIDELSALFATDAIDIEFAIDRTGQVHLLQVRPLLLTVPSPPIEAHADNVARIANRLTQAMSPHPYLRGRRGVFGVMPDWNPAEIVGVRPRPLAFSLYRDLVTDSIWAYQRHNYGYRNLRSFPLIISLGGQPYVDVRVSFNSFIPADLADDLADRLVNHYVDRLVAAPNLHDKVEFEIVFSCYTIDLPERLSLLGKDGFNLVDRQALAESLRRLTNRVIAPDTGLWRTDLAKLDELERRRKVILQAPLDPIAKIYWLIEDCKRYGTLPFAGLARAGFIAVQMLNGLVRTGLITADERARFMAGLDTVGGLLARDLAGLPRPAFLAEYGHLRPGTYDILSPRYDQAPDQYFDAAAPLASMTTEDYVPSPEIRRRLTTVLDDHGIGQDADGLFAFMRAGIVGRERAKFVFTRNLSAVLELLADLGAAHGHDRAAMSYADIADIKALYAETTALAPALAQTIAKGRAAHAETLSLALPPLITDPAEVWSFALSADEPNFITMHQAEALTAPADPSADLAGRIVLAPSADPGFDWLFARGIAGLITAYGGANSHMAIRAGELGLPAAIGVGETRFAELARARRIALDCANRRLTVLA